jgi:pimeloyl-ACP methyl ester carboxylesterase
MKRIIMAALLILAGSWLVGQEAKAAPPCVHPGIIFVANDAGDTTALTENLCEVLSVNQWPMRVATTRWSSFGGPARDYNYAALHRAHGLRMAAQVMAAQRAYPGAKIYLMGHSSGAHVVLAAAEALPPGSIDRIVLLSPAVSCTYDLRRALKASREGMDVYTSLQDGVLIDRVDMFGTADGIRDVPAAGVVGFRCPPRSAPDAQLYHLLRQYPFRPEMDSTGNWGYHFGSIQCNFLRLVVLPNMVSF